MGSSDVSTIQISFQSDKQNYMTFASGGTILRSPFTYAAPPAVLQGTNELIVPISADHYVVNTNLVPTNQAVVVIQLGSQYVYSPAFTISTAPSSTVSDSGASTASAVARPSSDAIRGIDVPFRGAMIFALVTALLTLCFL